MYGDLKAASSSSQTPLSTLGGLLDFKEDTVISASLCRTQPAIAWPVRLL